MPFLTVMMSTDEKVPAHRHPALYREHYQDRRPDSKELQQQSHERPERA